MTRVLVTGASGMVGRALLARTALAANCELTASTQGHTVIKGAGKIRWATGLSLDARTDWRPIVTGTDVVVHLAARVHQSDADAQDSGRRHHEINHLGTLRLARQAAECGVRRFIFVSTIKVHGEFTAQGQAWTDDSPIAPVGPYALSKARAEADLRSLETEFPAMAVTILRPPLLYGAGARANLAALAHAVQHGWPLPVGSIRNARTLLSVDAFADAIVQCVDHPGAHRATFVLGDDEDLSTPELVRAIARALGVRPRIWPCPVSWLQWGAAIVGRRGAIDRLTRSLRVDSSGVRTRLGWAPQADLEAGLRQAFSPEHS